MKQLAWVALFVAPIFFSSFPAKHAVAQTNTPTPTSTPTGPTHTPTPTDTPTPIPTPTQEGFCGEVEGTCTPTPTDTPTPTNTPPITLTPTQPTVTPTPTQEGFCGGVEGTCTPTPAATPPPIPTRTPTVTKTQHKCLRAKLRARVRLERCLTKNTLGVIVGKPDISSYCRGKFRVAVLQAGTACRYLDNGDGTVSDLNTRLVWEKKDMNCPGPHCYSDTFSWGTCDPPWNQTGTAFTTFLYGLNGGTSLEQGTTSGCFTGHCDWRLPTIEELRGIVNRSVSGCGPGFDPCVDPIFAPTLVDSYGYWSSTTDSDYPDDALAIYFQYAWYQFGTIPTGKCASQAVRAVRGGL